MLNLMLHPDAFDVHLAVLKEMDLFALADDLWWLVVTLILGDNPRARDLSRFLLLQGYLPSDIDMLNQNLLGPRLGMTIYSDVLTIGKRYDTPLTCQLVPAKAKERRELGDRLAYALFTLCVEERKTLAKPRDMRDNQTLEILLSFGARFVASYVLWRAEDIEDSIALQHKCPDFVNLLLDKGFIVGAESLCAEDIAYFARVVSMSAHRDRLLSEQPVFLSTVGREAVRQLETM
jgi:hypothetical protein